jgi:hypothetical protein
MKRRTILVLALAACVAAADDHSDALEAIAPLATALSNNDASSFLRHLPPDLPNGRELRENISALIAAAEVTSSVEVIDAADGAASLDWYMAIRSRVTAMVVERRRETVKIRYGKGKLLSIEPASFFAPPR